MAFLVLLESLLAKERAVFLLHDIFDYEFAEIAAIIGESAAYCRQLAKRARAHVAEHRPRFAAAPDDRERLARRFLRAVSDGDLSGLVATLADDVVVWSDGGGKVNGEPGLVTTVDGALTGAVTFDIADGAIRAIYIVVNPDKLRPAPPTDFGHGAATLWSQSS